MYESYCLNPRDFFSLTRAYLDQTKRGLAHYIAGHRVYWPLPKNGNTLLTYAKNNESFTRIDKSCLESVSAFSIRILR